MDRHKLTVDNSLKAFLKNDQLHQWKGLKHLNVKSLIEKDNRINVFFNRVESSHDVGQLMAPFADFLISRMRDLEGIKFTFTRYDSLRSFLMVILE